MDEASAGRGISAGWWWWWCCCSGGGGSVCLCASSAVRLSSTGALIAAKLDRERESLDS